MAKSSLKVSQSRVKLWRRCHRAHFNKYVLRLMKKSVSRPLQFGRIVHSMTEADAEGDDPMKVLDKINIEKKKLFSAEKEMYGEIIRDIRDIMTSYFSYYSSDELIYLRRNGKNSEHYFEIEIAPGIILIGYMDALARTQNKLKWMVERKTFKKRPNPDDRWRNMQSAIYLKANDLLGWPQLDGLCWDFIHNKPPAIPQRLQSGDISKKKISSLPVVIERFLKDNKLSREKYKSLLVSAEQNMSNYFFRVFTPINQNLVETIFEEFVDTSIEIAEYGETRKDRTIEQHCAWCDFEKLCRAQLLDMDVDFVIRREYEIRPKSKEAHAKKKTTRKKPKAKTTRRKKDKRNKKS